MIADDRLVSLSEDTECWPQHCCSEFRPNSTPHFDLWSAESKECFSAQFAESIDSGDNKGSGIKIDQCVHVCSCESVQQLCP